ncbi:UDP-2,4-diacetamido-2,4,6-trideoxy-beta-L-altropyranose hydrolase [uncultured Sulfitobacter sp.]|uniref:UDP-2,4-diacetamido-2,4, 6-trideoxy-beta-L-altropyranose hydrolase n=1 Tax=uncultured Sulfitobacter sp. TaxID=191468 RepID=UPI002626A8BC|nr:UDP-2,4-diacetamido-2,4,6-trideoxy-beta-L-altropyranose hydrolase [uncultured Sulfitobacter sp.]
MALDVLFRADSSVDIGTGHVMRCLTLADTLRAAGARPRFVCRDLPGHSGVRIAARGHSVTLLPAPAAGTPAAAAPPDHAGWLAVSQDTDAAQTRDSGTAPDWIVVDHYALDARWERAAAAPGTRILATDDLMDRPHAVDLLLDQTLGRRASDYAALAPGARVLAGSDYALLRPEFAARRAESLARTRHPVRDILVSLGGIDGTDATGRVLSVLARTVAGRDMCVTVVMGSAAPHLARIRAQAAAMPVATRVVVDVDDMARRMVRSDISIGAAGSTSWERCCLGLPGVIAVLADNQRAIAAALAEAGAAGNAGPVSAGFEDRLDAVLQDLLSRPRRLAEMGRAAGQVTDGTGACRVADIMMESATP